MGGEQPRSQALHVLGGGARPEEDGQELGVAQVLRPVVPQSLPGPLALGHVPDAGLVDGCGPVFIHEGPPR